MRLAIGTLIGVALAAWLASEHGAVRVIDGDTIDVDGHRVRLFAIDAPERGEAGAREATDNLRRLVAGRRVTCEQIDRDRYGRAVSLCRAGGLDLSESQLRLGHAVVYCFYVRRSRPSMLPQLRRLEAEARRERRGIWARPFVPWRRWGCS